MTIVKNVKHNSDQFFGSLEWNRFSKSLREDGYKKIIEQFVSGYGIVQDSNNDPSFNFYKVVQGSGVDKLTVRAGIALDSDLNTIEQEVDIVDAITQPTDSTDRYVILSHETSNIEEGIVSIDGSGGLSGVDTKFTEVLRGQGNHAVKVQFPNSASNTGIYEIAEVTNDTVAIVSGASFVNESDLQYIVVGTFQQGVTVNPSSLNVYELSKPKIELRTSSTLIDGKEFLLATVQSDGATSTIVDNRSSNLFGISFTEGAEGFTQDNPLIGVEFVTFSNEYQAGGKSLVQVGWGYRAGQNNWSFDAGTNKLTITNGGGGTYDDNSFVQAGDFNGWLLYFPGLGETYKITNTTPGANVVIDVPSLSSAPDPASFTIVILPDAETVTIGAFPFLAAPDFRSFTFAVNGGYAAGIAGLGFFELPFIPPSNPTILTYTFQKGPQIGINNLFNDGDYTDELGGTSNVTSSQLTVKKNPDNFQETKADLDEDNKFTAVQALNQYDHGDLFSTTLSLNLADGNIVTFSNPGSAFELHRIFNIEDGSILDIYFIDDTVIQHEKLFLDLSPIMGDTSDLSKFTVKAGTMMRFYKTTTASQWRATGMSEPQQTGESIRFNEDTGNAPGANVGVLTVDWANLGSSHTYLLPDSGGQIGMNNDQNQVGNGLGKATMRGVAARRGFITESGTTNDGSLFLFTVPAFSLQSQGKGVKIKAWGTYEGELGPLTSKYAYIEIDGVTTIILTNSGAYLPALGEEWQMETIIQRDLTADGWASNSLAFDGENPDNSGLRLESGVLAADWVSDVDIDIRYNFQGGISALNGNITMNGFVIEYF